MIYISGGSAKSLGLRPQRFGAGFFADTLALLGGGNKEFAYLLGLWGGGKIYFDNTLALFDSGFSFFLPKSGFLPRWLIPGKYLGGIEHER